jgi:hypothetical protein
MAGKKEGIAEIDTVYFTLPQIVVIPWQQPFEE